MIARLAVAAMWLLHGFPLPLLARLGQAFGMLLYVAAPARRRICLINLERCFPELTGPERRRMARRHFQVLARSILERGILWWSPQERIKRLVRVAGREHLDAAIGSPLILFTPHFVGLDAAFSRLSCDYDMSGIYAKQKSAVFDRIMLRGRMRFGNQVAFSRQDSVRAASAALRRGLPFYYLPDMDFGPRSAIFVPFFGVPAATVTGLSRLAKLSGARVIPCIAKMLPGGQGYEVRCFPAWDNYPTDDVTADTRRMNAFIEDRVREMPEQYYWTHKRFKTRPQGEPKWY